MDADNMDEEAGLALQKLRVIQKMNTMSAGGENYCRESCDI